LTTAGRPNGLFLAGVLWTGKPLQVLIDSAKRVIAIRLLALVLAGSPALVWTGSTSGFTDIRSPDFFPILTWDPQHGWAAPHVDEKNGLQSIAECNFNMAGFVLPRDLKECEKLGLGAILLPTDPAFKNTDYFRQWKNLTDQAVDQRVRDIIKGGGHSKAVKGYFICDEPGVSEFAGLAKAVAAVKQHAPGKLAYINLFPDYATIGAPDKSQLGTASYTEYLERFISEVHPQCLSYDNYMVEVSGDLHDHAKAAGYFQNLLEVRRVALKHNLPYLQIVASNQIRPAHRIPSPQNLLLQAYTTLAAGCRGVTWYTYYARKYPYAPIDNDGDKTVAWHYLKEVNRQITVLAPALAKLRSTGVYFTTNQYSSAFPALPGEAIKAVETSAPLLIGEMSNAAGTRYAMLVNISLERTTKVSITPANYSAGVQQISSENGKPKPFNPAKDVLWLSAGQGVLLSFE
jgi:hypothetical protein